MIVLLVAEEHILKVGSRLDMVYLIKPKLWAWRMLRVPDWRLEGWGHLELNIKDDAFGC